MKRPLTVAALLAAGIAFALPAAAQELTGTLKKIKDTGTITIGHRESSIPFSYLDDKQQPVGYAMDLCMKIVDAVKAELKMPEPQGRAAAGHLREPHPADAERHHRPRMRLDHQLGRAPEAGRVRPDLLRHQRDRRGEEGLRHQERSPT